MKCYTKRLAETEGHRETKTDKLWERGEAERKRDR